MHWFLGPKIMKSLEWSKQTFHFMNHLPFRLENASWATSTRMRIHFVKESEFLFPRVFFFCDRFSCWSICMMWSLCGGLATQICEVGTKYSRRGQASLVNGGLSVTLTKSFNCLNRLCVFACCWSFRPDIYAVSVFQHPATFVYLCQTFHLSALRTYARNKLPRKCILILREAAAGSKERQLLGQSCADKKATR